jgi:hypothetical protein
MAYKMNGFGGFGSPVKQKKIKLGPLKPGYLGDNYTEKGKAVNYINKANMYKAKSNPKTAGPGSIQKATTKRKFSTKARSVGIKKGFGSTLSKFFGGRAFGPISLLGGTLGTGLTTQASNKGRTKMTSKQMKKVNTQLQKTTYEGKKKKYK